MAGRENMDENLRIYIRRLTVQLRIKESELTDLKDIFSKLQCQFDQLDYAFKKNLQLHQQQIIVISELRLSQKELEEIDRNRSKQFSKLKDQLIQVTKEKEANKNCLDYWKQSVIDQKIFYEEKFKECLKEWKIKDETDSIIYQEKLKEIQSLAEKRIQDISNRFKLNEEEGEVIRKKAIILQGDIDVLKHKTDELAACLMENFLSKNENLQTIGSCIVKVLGSLNTPNDDYNKRIKILKEELLKVITCQEVNSGGNNSDNETLKNQNLVLREVVKKLKNELNKVQKENLGENVSMKELIELNLKNKNLRHLLTEKDAELKKVRIESKENIEKTKIDTEIMKSRENEQQRNVSGNYGDLINYNTTKKTVEVEEELVTYSGSQEGEKFDDDKSQGAYLEHEKGQVEKFRDRTIRSMMKSPELNLISLNSGQSSVKNDITLKDKQKVENNLGGCLNNEKNRDTKINRGQFEPIESHLNSVQYKEYFISISKNHYLKIRHPIDRKLLEKIFHFHFVYSEIEYQSMPIDEVVFYFDWRNIKPIFIDSRMTNCSTQTISILRENIFTQTTTSKEMIKDQASAGFKILNSERRAIERSLQDLEKTVSIANKETLKFARSMIINNREFSHSEEFFDCIKYLSQYGAT